MFKHIMVPLDGSKLAETALDYVGHLVGAGSRITLVSVVQLPQFPIYDFYPTPSTVIPKYETALDDAIPFARDYLARIADRLREEISAEVDTLVETGEPGEMLVSKAEALKVDAIVMSTHGRSGLGRWLFGSVTQKVLEAGVCPVFVVPNLKRAAAKTQKREAASQTAKA